MADRVQAIVSLFDKYGSQDYIGEEVSQLEHSIQSAMAAENEGYDESVIVAALLHDIGHLVTFGNAENSMGGFGQKLHEESGSDYLRSLGFREDVCKMVQNHVKAKRYLVSKYPEYLAKLSLASQTTLKYQGGLLNEEEMKEFENDPLFEKSLHIRGFDDKAKIKDMPNMKKLSYFEPMMMRMLSC